MTVDENARLDAARERNALIVGDLRSAGDESALVERRGGGRRRTFARFAPLVPMALATLLLFWRLGHNSYWIDEADSLAFAQLPWDHLRSAIRHLDAVFILYYALLHVWIALFGSPLAGRVLSALCGLATIPLVYAIGVRLYDRGSALVATLLYVASFAFLEPAREVRMYALLTLSVTAAWLLLLRMFERPTALRAAAYAGCLAVALWIHPFAALTAFAQAFVCLAWSRRRAAAFAGLASIAFAVSAMLPLIVLARPAGGGQIDWIERPTLYAAWIALRDGSGGTVAGLAGAALLVWAAVQVVRERAPGRFALLAWAFIPPIAAFAVSVVVKPVFTWRYLVEIGPAAALLIAGLVMHVPLRIRTLLAALLVVSSLLTLRGLSKYAREDWWSVGADLRQHAQPDDALAIYPPGLSLSYQLARRRELRSAPHLALIYPAVAPPVWAGTTKRTDRVPPFAQGHPRLWLITQTGTFGERVDASLQPRYRRDFERADGLVTLAHYTAR